jgi:quercetin dioxygenase-like cupin family protein
VTVFTTPHETPDVRFEDIIDYPKTGMRRQALAQDASCQYSLISVAAGTKIATHSVPRNATVTVIEGQGVLVLEDKSIALEPGVFVCIPAAAPHSVEATGSLTFLLVFSQHSPDSGH